MQFYQLMASRHGCYVTASDRRFADAHDYWIDDAERMLGQSHPDTDTLDHFKHASIIAFWLRRLVPINDIYFGSETLAVRAPGGRAKLSQSHVTNHQAHFVQYGSERCALYAGFYICLSYEVQRAETDKRGAENLVILGKDPPRGSDLPAQFREEYPMLLKTKNMSAHGLYMMYCALFSDIRWRVKSPALS
jgi:hypothetical protein